MQVFRTFVAGLIALLAVGLVNAQPQQDPEQQIIARVGDGHVITLGDLRAYVDDHHYLARYPDRPEAYARGLEDMVTAQLKRIDFFESGLHRDAELLKRIQRVITEELILEFFRTQYQEKYINEEAIRDAYEKMGRQVIYRQIILPKPRNASPEERDSLEAIAAEIRNQLDEGRDFAELASQFSVDTRSARRGGIAEPITWRKSLTNRRDYVIFNLEASAVRTLETRGSYDIVQVERYEEVPVASLDEVRGEIASTLRSRFMQVAVDEFESDKREAIDTSSVSWNQEGLRQVVEWSSSPNFYERDYRETLFRALADGRNLTLMTHSKGVVDVEEFLRLLDNVLILGRSGSHDVEVIKDFILEAVRTDAIARRARELGLEEALMSPHTPSTVFRSRLVGLYNQRAIEEQLPLASEEALRDFYKAHKDSLFYQLAAVSLYALIRSDREEAEALWSQVEQGVPFEELTGRWLVRSFVRNREGEIESNRSREAPYLGEVAFELEEGEVLGPIAFDQAEEGRQYAIIKLNARREERPLRYEEVEDTIAEVFRAYHRERIEAAVEEALRARYQVTIYQDVLEDHVAAE